jgi:hypothetical protein
LCDTGHRQYGLECPRIFLHRARNILCGLIFYEGKLIMYTINSRGLKSGATVFARSVLACSLLLTGCGGGGGSTAAAPAAGTLLTGTAATGLPIVGGTVFAIDKNGTKFPATATTSANGAYTINVAGGVAPFILVVTGTTATGLPVNLTSIAATNNQTVNITPLTDLIVSSASGQVAGQTLATLCTPVANVTPAGCTAALTAATNGTNLTQAITNVTNLVAPVNGANLNPLTTAFVGGSHTGMDATLDSIVVAPAAPNAMMATVTLVNVPPASGGSLGSLAIAPGAPSAPVAPQIPRATSTVIAAAATGITALTEINACMGSFAALFPANMTVAPTAAQVTPFIDATFTMGGPGTTFNQAAFITKMSTLASLGTGGLARPGGALSKTLGLSSFDFTRQPAAAGVVMTTAPVSPTTAWVKIDATQSGGGIIDMKMIKGAAYPGCAGGWKMAGQDHINLHMNARISKNSFGIPAVTTYTRQLPFHAQTANAVAEGVDSITVSGPGLFVYSGTPATPVGAATPVTLVVPAVPPVAGAIQLSWLGIKGQINVANTNLITSFYGNAEAIQSCQDLALIAAPAALPPAGTPCYDETAVAPGAVFTATVYGPAVAPAAAPVLYAFPFEIKAVPLSRAYVVANDANLFAQSITATTTIASLQTAIAGVAIGAPIDGFIKYNYTVSSVYGAAIDSCGVGLSDAAGNLILNAEQSAVGQSTTCTFTTTGLNFGSLAKPAAAISAATGNWKYVGVQVLGNQAGSSLPY